MTVFSMRFLTHWSPMQSNFSRLIPPFTVLVLVNAARWIFALVFVIRDREYHRAISENFLPEIQKLKCPSTGGDGSQRTGAYHVSSCRRPCTGALLVARATGRGGCNILAFRSARYLHRSIRPADYLSYHANSSLSLVLPEKFTSKPTHFCYV